MVDGDDCRWLNVEGSIGCAVEYGAWYGLWGVWLERCMEVATHKCIVL